MTSSIPKKHLFSNKYYVKNKNLFPIYNIFYHYIKRTPFAIAEVIYQFQRLVLDGLHVFLTDGFFSVVSSSFFLL